MKTPENLKELRRFLGMYNYLTRFVPNMAEHTKPLRDLLKKDVEWTWTDVQEKAYQNLKNLITQTPVLATYDVDKETRVSADASSYGLGGCLEQRQENGNWQPVCYISRSLTDSERRFAQIEKEGLTITWSCERLSHFILGKRIMILTDQKPLTTIFGGKSLNELSVRLQRMKMRMMRFTYDIKHVSGKEFYVADTLSRSPISTKNEDEDLECQVNLLMQTINK